MTTGVTSHSGHFSRVCSTSIQERAHPLPDNVQREWRHQLGGRAHPEAYRFHKTNVSTCSDRIEGSLNLTFRALHVDLPSVSGQATWYHDEQPMELPCICAMCARQRAYPSRPFSSCFAKAVLPSFKQTCSSHQTLNRGTPLQAVRVAHPTANLPIMQVAPALGWYLCRHQPAGHRRSLFNVPWTFSLAPVVGLDNPCFSETWPRRRWIGPRLQ
jgi:hypothetical protein